MPLALLEQTSPETQLSGAGNGNVPPAVETAIAAPQPPEGEKFDPQKVIDQAKFDGITTELRDTQAAGNEIIEQHEAAQFNEIASNLGDVASKGAEIISQESVDQQFAEMTATPDVDATRQNMQAEVEQHDATQM